MRETPEGQPSWLSSFGVSCAASGIARLRAAWKSVSGGSMPRPVTRNPCGTRFGSLMFVKIFFGSNGRLFVASTPSGPLK